jgi:poly(3-hydroxybutyrate) depolymerase
MLVLLVACSAVSTFQAPPPLPSASAAPAPVTVGAPAPTQQLASYNINPQHVFVAGISSGAAFAVQMHVAHSATFKGAAIYAGAVYYCSQDSVEISLAACGGDGGYESELTASEAYLDQNSAQGTIDSESNLSGQSVYLWSGTKDTIVEQPVMLDLQTEYQHYGANVTTDFNFPAEHGWESPDGQLPCGVLRSPYMIACDSGGTLYDSEKTWLSLFLGPLQPRNNGTLQGQLISFDQRPFGARASNSMDTNGDIFVPSACAQGALCALLVAFHGCRQGHAQIGTTFAVESGIDEWADANNVVVLYPYAIESPGEPRNPEGCWDWWGYDDPNYALRAGTQISIVYKMVQQVMGGP